MKKSEKTEYKETEIDGQKYLVEIYMKKGVDGSLFFSLLFYKKVGNLSCGGFYKHETKNDKKM